VRKIALPPCQLVAPCRRFCASYGADPAPTLVLEPSQAEGYFQQSNGKGTKMSDNAKTLIEQARSLPPQDRIALVEDVLASLDGADSAIDQMWAREASDRLAAYRRGELAAKNLADIVAKFRP
jgi:putative addiction module component (TIGR02574 family)